MRTIAIIPARGNSKGIPRKNLAKLGGVPLIAYTIFSALSCSELDSIYLSTEDTEIWETALAYAKVLDPALNRFKIIHRPLDLSQDWVQNDDVCHHALRQLTFDGIYFDAMVVLQPTSPFRESEEISQAIELYYNNPGTVVSITTSKKTDEAKFAWELDEDEIHMVPIGHDPTRRFGRQWSVNIPAPDGEVFYEDGSIYVLNPDRFKHERVCRMPPYIPFFSNEELSIDIDTPEDLEEAEKIIKSHYKFVRYPN